MTAAGQKYRCCRSTDDRDRFIGGHTGHGRRPAWRSYGCPTDCSAAVTTTTLTTTVVDGLNLTTSDRLHNSATSVSDADLLQVTESSNSGAKCPGQLHDVNSTAVVNVEVCPAEQNKDETLTANYLSYFGETADKAVIGG